MSAETGIEEKVHDFYDIVTLPRKPGFVEKHLPELLSFARQRGYFMPPQIPQYPSPLTVNMPHIPFDNGGQKHAFLYFLEKVGELVDRVDFSFDQKREFEFRLDPYSWERAVNVGKTEVVGFIFPVEAVMEEIIALSNISKHYLKERGYQVTSAGAGTDKTILLTLRKISGKTETPAEELEALASQ